MSTQSLFTQLLIIGAGPGGYAAAFRAADRGIKVTLVDTQPNPGGVCLYRGCIPSKALLHVARVMTEAQECKEYGVEFDSPRVDFHKLQSWKNGIVQKLTQGLGQLVKARGIEYIQGTARFLDSQTCSVLKKVGGEVHFSFDNTILATGSRPTSFENWPMHSPHLLNSTDALNLDSIPKRMLVVGGGYIGLELGTVYATMGTKVSVVEMTSGLLPGADVDLIRPLTKKLKDLFEKIEFNTKVEKIEEVDDGCKVWFKGDTGESSEVFEKVLVSVGRKPNSSGLGLESTKVEIDDEGFIKVDAQRRTADPKIFAIGDLVGQPLLAHKATHEGLIAVDAIGGGKAVFEPRAIPAVVYTDPEIAWCGLTEIEAKEEGREVKVVRFPWAASGRAMTLGRTEGSTKLLLDPESETVLGVSIVGPGAGEMIAEGVLAIEMGATASDLKLCIHPHPTLSETVMEAAEVFFGESTHLYRPKRTK